MTQEQKALEILRALAKVGLKADMRVEDEMPIDEERQARRSRLKKATAEATKVLKKGDRITVTKCPGTKRWIIFDHWNGDEIISASGEGEYAATNISRLNGVTVDFNGNPQR